MNTNSTESNNPNIIRELIKYIKYYYDNPTNKEKAETCVHNQYPGISVQWYTDTKETVEELDTNNSGVIITVVNGITDLIFEGLMKIHYENNSDEELKSTTRALNLFLEVSEVIFVYTQSDEAMIRVCLKAKSANEVLKTSFNGSPSNDVITLETPVTEVKSITLSEFNLYLN